MTLCCISKKGKTAYHSSIHLDTFMTYLHVLHYCSRLLVGITGIIQVSLRTIGSVIQITNGYHSACSIAPFIWLLNGTF